MPTKISIPFIGLGIKVAWRNLQRNKVYSFINISGLALGLASAIIILLSVENELSIDRYYPKKDRLYRVWNSEPIEGRLQSWLATCAPLGPAFKEEIPEVKETARTNWGNLFLVSYKEKVIRINGLESDPGLITMFGFPFLEGNPGTALNGVNQVVITQSCARKIFGDEDPMNKVIKIDNQYYFTVTGVMEDLPGNSSFNFEMMLPWKFLEAKNSADYFQWDNNSYKTYVELKNGASPDVVNAKMHNVIKKHDKESTSVPFLQNVQNWNLYSEFVNGKVAGGNIEYVRMVSVIAFFILLIACINFMNLSTARSEKRAREVGIRKVVGARREGLIVQFLGESVFIATIAFLFALFLVQLLLPSFNNMVGRELVISYRNPWYWLAAVSITLFTGIVAGSYPAFYLSSFLPARVLKNRLAASKHAVTPRKVLVVFQFVISISLIISTIIIEGQISYAQNRPAGYDRENLLYHFATGDLKKNYKLLKNELLSSGTATGVFCIQQSVTNSGSNTWGVTWDGNTKADNRVLFDLIWTQDEFAKPMNLQMIAGRDLNTDQYPGDTARCLINESALKVMRFSDPVGQNIHYNDKTYTIAGVFRDFIWGSPFQNTRAMLVFASDTQDVIHVRLNGQRPVAANLEQMGKIFKKYNPAYPFEYQFIDLSYAAKFREEQIIGRLATISSILAIIISCLGLFGLAAFTAEQRTKEIGVRRVLGASVRDIVALLSKDFLGLVVLSAIIAFPLAYWLMHNWLQNYSYQVGISVWVFLVAGTAALFIALVTVSFQAVKAALASPAKSLRTE